MRKPLQAPEDGKAKSPLEIKLRKQISNLRKENLQLRKNIKISANEKVPLPDQNSSVNINAGHDELSIGFLQFLISILLSCEVYFIDVYT